MTESRPTKTKDKITYKASIEGLERANKALKRRGIGSKEKFAESIQLSRSTITKFFNGQPIQFDSFKRICDKLELLDWIEIAEFPEKEQSNGLVKNDCSSPDINDGEEQVQRIRRQLSVIDKDNKTVKAVIVLEGDINSINNDLSVSLELFLRKYSGHTIKITNIKEGSIKLFIQGSKEDIQLLKYLIDSGELTTISGFPVQDIQVLSESLDDDESTESDDKWRLVQEIVSQPIKMRHLSGVDLSDADLSGVVLNRADLSGANLSGADLSGANLSGADLSGANLSGANLSGANLSGANLSDANLSDADLSGANLSGANLSGANLSGANLSDANLNGVDLHDVVIDETTRINNKWRLVWEITNRASENRELSDADLSEAVLIGVNLSDANLSGANLRSTKLNNADLSHGDLQRANLLCADLSGANLSGANLSGANLSGANLSGADLSRVNLSNAKLISDVDLSDANLSDANLSNADLSEANLSGADLSGADLTYANLSNANLSGADLREANLRRADLSRAKVEEAKFGRNKGLTETLKINLEKRGAKFEDFPGDRSLVSLGRPS